MVTPNITFSLRMREGQRSKKRNWRLQNVRKGGEVGLRTLETLQNHQPRTQSLQRRNLRPPPLRNFTEILIRRRRPDQEPKEDREETKSRTPVRVKIKRLEKGRELRTPAKGGGSQNKNTGGKRGKKKESLSPSQRRIENYFLKLRGGPTGLSMRSKSPNKTQGTPNSPLEGVLEVGACAPTSRPGTSPLPVERGGGQKEAKKKALRAKVLERWPHQS